VRGAALYDDSRLQLITDRRFLPIEAFAYWLRRGDLRAVLDQWAPHVPHEGAGGAAGTADPTEGARTSRRRSLLVSAAIVLLAGGALALAFAPAGTRAAALRFLVLPVALAFVLLAARNFASAARLFRSGHAGFALLWAAVGAIQVLVAFTLAAQVFALKGG